jgi:hypothetical protein
MVMLRLEVLQPVGGRHASGVIDEVLRQNSGCLDFPASISPLNMLLERMVRSNEVGDMEESIAYIETVDVSGGHPRPTLPTLNIYTPCARSSVVICMKQAKLTI